jgi:hypothetical protein
MKLVFLYWAFEDQGSGLIIQGYTEAARALGHEVTVYGPPHSRIPLRFARDLDGADAVVCIFEWTTDIQYGDNLDYLRLLTRVPRERRVILDGDGKYNDLIEAEGDYNHKDAAAARRWVEVCDSLSDKVCQPTYHPLRPNVRTFSFYAYNPAWEVPLDPGRHEFGMVYVGHSKFRWRPMLRVLRAVEPVRDRVGRIAIVGYGWDKQPSWAAHYKMEDAYATEPDFLGRLGVEVLPAVPFGDVVGWMSKGLFNPVVSRPTFTRLHIVTPRFFETPAATIPLFGLEESYVEEIYGPSGRELVLPLERPEEKVLDLVRRPEHYAAVVADVRLHLAREHSHVARLRQLIDIVNS